MILSPFYFRTFLSCLYLLTCPAKKWFSQNALYFDEQKNLKDQQKQLSENKEFFNNLN